MQRIPRERALVYALDGSRPPELRVAAGEAFAVETHDASSGLLLGGERLPIPDDLPYLRHEPARANPVGGPVHVAGVAAGQRVRVDIVEIRLAAQGVAYNRPGISPLGDARRFPAAGEPFAVPVAHGDGVAGLSPRLRLPLAPMIGTLACAPEWEVHASASAQGGFGGNLDVSEFRPGAAVYLNAHHEGALLYAGDVHGCQGDGEYLGVADESPAEVVLRASPADGPPLPAPRVVTPERLIALGIGRPLEEAAHAAVEHLLAWLVAEHGVPPRDAYLAVGLHPGFSLRVHQMTAIRALRYVVGASLPRAFVEELADGEKHC